MTVAAVLPLASRGERLDASDPVALQAVGGVPMLARSLLALASADVVELVVVAAPPVWLGAVRRLLADHDAEARVGVVTGASSWGESVRLAVSALPANVDVVLVHDPARPLVPVRLVEAVAAAVLRGADAVVPAVPVVDTIKQVDGSSVVRRTLDRSRLHAVQTPQGFRRAVLERAHAAALAGADGADLAGADGADLARAPQDAVNDDGALVARLGVPVRMIPGAEEAFRIAGPVDLLAAESLLTSRRTG